MQKQRIGEGRRRRMQPFAGRLNGGHGIQPIGKDAIEDVGESPIPHQTRNLSRLKMQNPVRLAPQGGHGLPFLGREPGFR